jgi:hypothetical protein
MDLKQLFREHPETVGETYVEHCTFALRSDSDCRCWAQVSPA